MRKPVQRLHQLFSHEDRLLVLIDPDPDSIASALALKRLLWHRLAACVISHIRPITRAQNKRLVELGARYSAKFVATNDVHYIEQTDAKYQDVLLAIQTGALLSDPNRMRYEDPSYYLRSPQEMSTLFAEIPESLSNTVAIAERCKVDLGFKGYHLPEFPVPDGHTTGTYLRVL